WGVLCGLGFGLMEGLLNGAVAGPSWMAVASVRLLTTALHALTGGLMGLGWYYAAQERRFWPLAGLFGLSLALHALWNGAVLLVGLLTLFWGGL
ncbi:MAG: PrsW family intramembrane metalloprotease, partial [Thermoleophilia bacterium]|nr:PrsW family intramembrane metalloprotease [Thermoleophilia bacterium]